MRQHTPVAEDDPEDNATTPTLSPQTEQDRPSDQDLDDWLPEGPDEAARQSER
jgi:hypothetical protein